MNFNHDPKAGPQLFDIRAMLHNRDQHNEYAEHAIYQRLAQQLSMALVKDATVVTHSEYGVEYDLRVYVLTPSQLARMVQEKADQLREKYPTMTFDVNA